MWPILFDLRPIDYDIWSMKCDLWPILSDLWPIYIYLWTMEQTYDLVMWTVTYHTKCRLLLVNCKHDLWPQPQPTKKSQTLRWHHHHCNCKNNTRSPITHITPPLHHRTTIPSPNHQLLHHSTTTVMSTNIEPLATTNLYQLSQIISWKR